MNFSMDMTSVLVSLLTLTILEVVLGIDNLVFISILSSRLPSSQQKTARRVGLLLAWVTRLLLLGMVVWLSHLTKPLFSLFGTAFSARDLLLLFGGLFLLVKATHEIHLEMEAAEEPALSSNQKHYSHTFVAVVSQIALIDIVFSLDTVITAIALVKEFWVMATAISIAILCMIFASEPLSRFVMRYPTVKMLALSFLILIGMVLVADGLHFEVPRGYVYFSVCFSLLVESLNLFRKKKRKRSLRGRATS